MMGVRTNAVASSTLDSTMSTPQKSPTGSAFLDEADFDENDSGHLNMSFRKSGASNQLSIKEQEKLMDDIKKENFDLKLRVTLLQERLAKLAPENVESAINENIELTVKNEALESQNNSYKTLLNETHTVIEQLRQSHASSARVGNEAEAARLKSELAATQQHLTKALNTIQKYESQLSLFDEESHANAQKMRQLELELSSAQKRLAEANHSISTHKAEIASLDEQLAIKNDTLKSFKQDMNNSTSNIELIMRQMHDLQEALKRSELEKEQLLLEQQDPSRANSTGSANLDKASDIQLRLASLSSPRKSFDVLESKLLKELGQASRRVNDLEKQTTLTQSERDQLQSQSRKLTQEVHMGIKSLQGLVGKICEAALPHRQVHGEVSSLTQAVEEVQSVCKSVLEELDDAKIQCKSMDSHILKLQSEYDSLAKERNQLNETLAETEINYERVSAESSAKGFEIKQLHETVRSVSARLKDATEQDIPRLQRENDKMSHQIKSLSTQIEATEIQLRHCQHEKAELEKRFENLQSIAVQSAADLTERKNQLAALQQTREDLLAGLSEKEETINSLNKKLDTLNAQLCRAEKVKTAFEEQFNRELKSLHSTNSELKMQLSTALSAKGEFEKRVEHLEHSLSESENSKAVLLDRYGTRDNTLGTLKRDHEILVLEHKTMEAELAEKNTQVQRLEAEIIRVRKDDLNMRKNVDGIEHLQAKVDNLNALNAFLREQADNKEKSVKDLEEKLRRQTDEMRTAFTEIEQQSKKLKKREQLINQALKRLEQINYMRTMGSPFRGGEDSSNASNTSTLMPQNQTPARPSTLSNSTTMPDPLDLAAEELAKLNESMANLQSMEF